MTTIGRAAGRAAGNSLPRRERRRKQAEARRRRPFDRGPATHGLMFRPLTDTTMEFAVLRKADGTVEGSVVLDADQVATLGLCLAAFIENAQRLRDAVPAGDGRAS